MPEPTADSEAATPNDAWTPPEPELVEVPADLPVLEPSHVISLPLNEQITSAVVVPDEHEGSDVLYVAVSQERVNVWAAVVYFVPEIALGLTGVLVLVALRKWWVGRRFLHRKGEAYCKKCWAGLTGVESATCPECGRKVAKTKRIAKRSRRSPLSPRWVWPAVALLAMLGSAVIWFGEGWHTAWRFGFDLSDRYTRRELYNYADRDSVFRINPMAGWLQWPSAKLAALGRNHDHPWIEALDDAYSENEGTHNRPLIRRYSIQDGQHLSTHPLPDRSQMQNKRGRGGAYLGEFNGIVFVSNGDQYYSLRYGHTDPWVTFPSETPDAHRSVLSISLDGQYLIVGLSDSSSSYYRVADTKQLVVIDTDSGKAIATLDLLDSLQDAPPPTTTSASSDNPTVRVVLEDWHDLGGIAIVEDQPQILLYLRPKLIGTHTTRILHWDFSQHTLTDGDILAPHPLPLDQVLIGPYSWSIQSINHYDDRLADYNALFELLSREQRFQYWLKHERLIGRTVGWLPSDTYVRVQSLHNPDEPAPYDRYDPLTSIPLYKLATTTSHTRPDRVLEFSHPHGRESASIILSPTGRLGVVRFGYNGPKLAVDVENVQALGHLGLSVNGNDLILFSEFANDERRLVIWSAHSNPASSSRYQSDVDEIRIFDLPE